MKSPRFILEELQRICESVNRILSFLESEDVGLGVDLLVKLDDGTAGAAEHSAAVLHHRALPVIVGKNISNLFGGFCSSITEP